MPSLSRFTNDDLPDHFAHQIRDFIRIHWFDIFQYDVHANAIGEDLKPVYFVMADDPALFSHAAAVTRSVECNGQIYACGGLSAVLTYPAFRHRGYASQTVRAATEHLESASLDLALLWTDPDKENFYSRFGWEYHPSVRILVGGTEAKKIYEAFTMIRFFSARAIEKRREFESHPIYIGEHSW